MANAFSVFKCHAFENARSFSQPLKNSASNHPTKLLSAARSPDGSRPRMFYLNLREMHRNPTYCWDLPAEGLEPTRSCDHWILSPARLPIPPRRRRECETTRMRRKLKGLQQHREAADFAVVRKFREG